MPIKLSSPIYKTFELVRSDAKYGNEGEPTIVTVRQASQAQHRLRQDFFATLERRFSNSEPDEVSLIQTLSMEELKELEVWLCLCECNIADENERLLFPSRMENDHPRLAMKREEFHSSWGKLFPDIANEIHEKVLEVNPLWRGSEGEEF